MGDGGTYRLIGDSGNGIDEFVEVQVRRGEVPEAPISAAKVASQDAFRSLPLPAGGRDGDGSDGAAGGPNFDEAELVHGGVARRVADSQTTVCEQ